MESVETWMVVTAPEVVHHAEYDVECEACGFPQSFLRGDKMVCWACDTSLSLEDSLTNPNLLGANLPITWQII